MADYITTFNVKDANANHLHSITFDPRDGVGTSTIVDSPFNYTYTSLTTFYPKIEIPGYVGKVETVIIAGTGQTVNITLYAAISTNNIGLVWDELIASHTVASTFGIKNSRLIPSETISDYYTSLTPVTSTMALDATVAKDSSVAKDSTVAKASALAALAGIAALDSTVAKEVTSAAIKTQTDLMSFSGSNIQARIADKGAFGSLSETTIKNAVWDDLTSSHAISDSMGLALSQAATNSIYSNMYVDQPVYSSNNVLTSCRIRIYSNPASVGTDSNVLFTYTMTATETAGRVLTYKTVAS